VSDAELQPLVLVADDEPDIVDLLVILLRRAGYEPVAAAAGDEALSAAREHRPDLCVLDGRMPNMHGFEVLRRLRSDPETAAIPVMILTATVDEEREVREHGIEPDSFMPKPFEADELLAEVARLIAAAK
jgi:CheY-like chemotaxis protein